MALFDLTENSTRTVKLFYRCFVLYNKGTDEFKLFKQTPRSTSCISNFQSVCDVCLYLIVHLPLQLDDLVLHARVELLQMFSRTSFNLKLFQLSFSVHASVCTLDDDGSGAFSSELRPLQPAADALLDDHGLVVQEELQRRE